MRRQIVFACAVILFLSIFLTPPAYAQSCTTPPANGLVGHWALDETSGTTITDSSGNNNNGTAANGLDPATDSVNGVVATALDFDGTDDLIDAGSSSSLDDIFAGGGAITAWINPRSWGEADFGRIVDKSASTGADNGYHFHVLSSGNLRFDHDFDGGDGQMNTTTAPIALNQWSHVAVVYNRDSAANDPAIYVQGVLQNADSFIPSGTALSDSSHSLIIGNHSDASRTFDGQIDDVRIYNRALSVEEIAQLYEYGFGDEGAFIFDENHLSLKYCNGTEWVHAGTGPYNPNAVYFDGVFDDLRFSPSLTDTNKVTGSFWLKKIAGQNGTIFEVDNAHFEIQNIGSVVRITGNNDAALRYDAIEAGSPFPADEWHHVMFSFDLSDNNKIHGYLNDVSSHGSVAAFVDTNLSLSAATNLLVGNNTTSSAGRWPFWIADFWLDFGTYIDLSVEANRRKFISASGAPMYLGPDGSIPTGSAPDVFLSGQTDDWHTNKGTAGGLNELGEITYSSSRPLSSTGLGSVSIGWDNSSSNRLAYVAALFEASSCTPSVNNPVWNSQNSNPASSYTLSSYTVPSVTDGMLVVAVASEDNDNNSEGVPVSVTFGGTPLTEAVTITQDVDKTASLYYLGNPSPSTGDIVVNTTGPVESIMVGAYVVDCVLNQAPTATQTDGNNASSVTTTFSSLPSDFIIVDSFMHGGSAAGTMSITGTFGVTEIFTQDTNSGVTSSQAAGYLVITNSAPSGNVRYNQDFNVMEYYNGTQWVAMGPIGGTPPTNGLIAHWPLDETSGTTVTDVVGTADGVYTNGGTDVTSIQGVLNTALEFQPLNNTDYVDLTANGLNLLQNRSAASASLWVRTDDIDYDGQQDLISFSINGNDNNSRFSINFRDTGRAEVGGRASDADTWHYSRTASGVITENKWHHIVGTVDYANNNINVYVDGVLLASGINGGIFDQSSTANTLSQRASLAASDSGIQEHLDGKLDDVRLYNRVLSATEVQQLYYYGLSNGLGDVDNGCASPAGIEGEMFYNADHNVMQYCNGEEWVGIGWAPP